MTISPADRRFIKKCIKETCVACGVDVLIGKIVYAFDFLGKNNLAMSYPHNNLIVFNLLWFNDLSRDALHELIVHEVCHIIDHHLHGNSSAHGKRWKALMRMAGFPQAKSTINVES